MLIDGTEAYSEDAAAPLVCDAVVYLGLSPLFLPAV